MAKIGPHLKMTETEIDALLEGVMMRGRAAVLEDQASEAADPHLAAARLDIGRKHGLSDPEGNVKAYDATAAGRSRRWFVFTPEHIVSWNNARL